MSAPLDGTFSLPWQAFRTAYNAVKPMALTDAAAGLPMLNGVCFEGGAGHMTMISTNQYALAVYRLPLEPNDQGEKPDLSWFRGCLRLSWLDKAIKTLAPSARERVKTRITFTVQDKYVAVSRKADGPDDYLAPVVPVPLAENFPTWAPLVTRALRAEPGDNSPLVVDPRLLARFQHAATANEPIVVRATAPNQPIVITSGVHFIGLLMPVRHDRFELASGQQWLDILDPGPEAAQPKRVASS